MKLYFVWIFLLLGNLYAFSYTQRTQILLEAKKLYTQYEMRKNRSEAWKKRKKVLIEKFESSLVRDINSTDKVLSRKAQKRKKEFYDSLKKQDIELNQALKVVKTKLNRLKRDFSFFYSTPLTKEEMFNGIKPKIKDKDQKIKIIKSFITTQTLLAKSLKEKENLKKKKKNIQNEVSLDEKQRRQLLDDIESKILECTSDIKKYNLKIMKLKNVYKKRYGHNIQKKDVANTILKNILASN